MTTQYTFALKDYLPFATSLFGAFLGALGAYWIGRFKEKRDEEIRRHTAIFAAQHALYSQWHVVEDLRRFLETLRNDKQRHLRLSVGYTQTLKPFLSKN